MLENRNQHFFLLFSLPFHLALSIFLYFSSSLFSISFLLSFPLFLFFTPSLSSSLFLLISISLSLLLFLYEVVFSCFLECDYAKLNLNWTISSQIKLNLDQWNAMSVYRQGKQTLIILSIYINIINQIKYIKDIYRFSLFSITKKSIKIFS